jgi:hypothetical protein
LGAAEHEHGATDLIPHGPEDDILDRPLLQRQANGGIVIGRNLAIGPLPFVKCLLS